MMCTRDMSRLREVEVYGPGNNQRVLDNTARENGYYEEMRRQGFDVPNYATGWTEQYVDVTVQVCEYVAEHAPDEVFGIDGVPALGIYVDDDSIAVGALGEYAYAVIRKSPIGLFVVSEASDRREEASAGGWRFNRYEDALKSIFFSWLKYGSGIKFGPLFFPPLNPEVAAEKYVWETHKHLFSSEAQRLTEVFADYHVLECERNPHFGIVSRERFLNTGEWLLRLRDDPEAWCLVDGAPPYLNMSYALDLDPVAFLDRVAVGLLVQKQFPAEFRYEEETNGYTWTDVYGVRHFERRLDMK